MRASSHRFYRPTSKTSIPDINGMPGKSAEKSEKRKENYIMADKIIENNQVSITGKITTGFSFSHQVYGEGFYTMELLVKRLSDSQDRIPVMVSERLVDVTQDYVGQYVEIHGQFRSYNRHGRSITAWCFPHLPGSCALLRKKRR